VFVEQKRQADFIAVFLSELNYPTTSIHGDREQPEREKALKDFKTKKMKILVATSVAARGLGKFFFCSLSMAYCCVCVWEGIRILHHCSELFKLNGSCLSQFQ